MLPPVRTTSFPVEPFPIIAAHCLPAIEVSDVQLRTNMEGIAVPAILMDELLSADPAADKELPTTVTTVEPVDGWFIRTTVDNLLKSADNATKIFNPDSELLRAPPSETTIGCISGGDSPDPDVAALTRIEDELVHSVAEAPVFPARIRGVGAAAKKDAQQQQLVEEEPPPRMVTDAD